MYLTFLLQRNLAYENLFFFFEDEYDAVEVGTIEILEGIHEKEGARVREIAVRDHVNDYLLEIEVAFVDDHR